MDDIRAQDRLIVALDFDSDREAMNLVKTLGKRVGFYKIGWQLFPSTGWSFVRALADEGKKIFLDLKIGDIDETVRAAVKNMPLEDGNLELLTIQGNGATVKAAIAGKDGNKKPSILMLTALSSWNDVDIKDFFGTENAPPLGDYIRLNAKKALDAGCDGVIASGASVRQIRQEFKGRDFLIVSPGIRPDGDRHDDHKRTLTPYDAITSGADYLVVGRPITRAGNPAAVAGRIIDDIDRASSVAVVS